MTLETPENLWKPEYSLDVANMDLQHKHFFQILEVLSQICQRAEKTAIKNAHLITILTEVRRYSLKHFHDEEVMLIKYKYPDIFIQCSEHDKYQRFVLEFINDKIDLYNLNPDDMITDENFELMKSLLEYITMWLQDHIQQKDRMYVEYVKKMKQVKNI
jgi:hemerythrin